MQELLKEIRQLAGLSQESFAKALGVTFATINRWENAKATPNKLAQLKLYEFCKGQKIAVHELTLSRINKIAATLNIGPARKLLYHGSKSGIAGKIAPISRAKCDFGQGFYMGTDPLQPLTLICDFEKSCFYILSIAMENLKALEVNADLEWAMLVAYNRGRMEAIGGTAFYNKYSKMTASNDIIIGSIADDRMFFVLDNFFQGNITDIALIKSLSALQLGKQYVAITQQACDAIKIEQEIEISYLERRFLQDLSSENRTKGVAFANNICRRYRREGVYFDEILEQQRG